MKDELKNIQKEIEDSIRNITNLEALREIEMAFFGRKGKLTSLLKNLKELPDSLRKEVGALANVIKKDAQVLLEDARMKIETGLDVEVENVFDPTIPGSKLLSGSLHPHTQMIYSLNDAFLSLGFEIYDGPEISSEAFVFDNLNFPEDHPAREDMDTYWLKGSDNKKSAERMA